MEPKMTNPFFVLGVPLRKNSRSGCSLYLFRQFELLFLQQYREHEKGCRFHPSRAPEITIAIINFKKICKKNLIHLKEKPQFNSKSCHFGVYMPCFSLLWIVKTN
jgi:hypothetical protein